MSTELALRAAHLPAVTDDDFLQEVKVQIAPKATDAELRFFANVVAKTQLDPWSRQVYLIPRWDSRARREVHRPQVSIDGLRLIAERTGKYEGQTPVEWCGTDGQWRDTWFSEDAPAAARVGVFKAGRSVPTYAVAHYDEYVVTGRDGKPSGLWKDKPRVMIAKCAEALALRKAFPQETSGLYTAEEMGRADVEVVDATAVEATAEAKPKGRARSSARGRQKAADAPEKASEWTLTEDAKNDLSGWYVKSGWWDQNAPEGQDEHARMRMQLAAVGADNGVQPEGDPTPLGDCLDKLTEEQFGMVKTALVEAAMANGFDAKAEA